MAESVDDAHADCTECCLDAAHRGEQLGSGLCFDEECETSSICQECRPCNIDHEHDPCMQPPICCDSPACDSCDEPACLEWFPQNHFCCDLDHSQSSLEAPWQVRSPSDVNCDNASCAQQSSCALARPQDKLHYIEPTVFCEHKHDLTGLATPLSMSSATSVSNPMLAVDPFHCHWENCDLSFLDSLQFDQHFLAQHLEPLIFDNSTTASASSASPASLVCSWNHCPVEPASVPALFDHIKHDHVEVEKHHRCKWLLASQYGIISPCGLCLSTAEDMTQHIIDDHIGSRQKEYICYWQDCDRCCRPFSQRQKITRHIVVHTGDRPFKCDICDYACSEETILKQHQRTHTGERPFSCSVCHKTFSASTALSVHMRTHTGFKPLTCKYPGCGKRFSESSNLAKHMRTHSKEKPYRCDEQDCSKCFQRPDQLKRHQLTVHKRDAPLSTDS